MSFVLHRGETSTVPHLVSSHSNSTKAAFSSRPQVAPQCGRWLLDRDDTPWYPGMRLFRQARAGVWDDVLASVAESVRSLSAAKR
ncbi:hypothetical protein [Acidithiobacillus ferridurans]|uniref:hypothetical protein n=1 Tax=Acidithiobacillus ferridurans TaxID=1232575 RepID=UPI001C07BE70|nr:hypothetical protein [Acidithiobacillus ferridurans]